MVTASDPPDRATRLRLPGGEKFDGAGRTIGSLQSPFQGWTAKALVTNATALVKCQAREMLRSRGRAVVAMIRKKRRFNEHKSLSTKDLDMALHLEPH